MHIIKRIKRHKTVTILLRKIVKSDCKGNRMVSSDRVTTIIQ